MLVFSLIYLAILLLLVVSVWKIYEKANQPGWACIVPIYNLIIYLKIINKPWWWILLFLVPIVNIVYAVWASNLLSMRFNKGTGFTVGLIFLPFIFYPILGFGDAQYNGQRISNDPLILDSDLH